MHSRKRPYEWWKTGKMLLYIWLGGTFVVTVGSLALLYPMYHSLQTMKAETVQAKQFIEKHRDLMNPSYALSSEPTREELLDLQMKVPVRTETSRLLVDLKGAVAASQAEWMGLKLAENPDDLPPMRKEKSEEKATDGDASPASKTTGEKPDRSDPPGVKRVWGDLHVQASYDQLEKLFAELHGLSRLVTVEGWEYTDRKSDRGDVRIRLACYVYEDEKLKDLPPLPNLDLPDRATGEKVSIGGGQSSSDGEEKTDASRPKAAAGEDRNTEAGEDPDGE